MTGLEDFTAITCVCMMIGYLTDTAIYAPPTVGNYAYNPPHGTFSPSQSPLTTFPAVGSTYVDPVFGSTIRRLTNDYSSGADHVAYSNQLRWNADATYLMHKTASGNFVALHYQTGAEKRLPSMAHVVFENAFFDPDDADRFFWYADGTSDLKYVLLSACTSSTPGTTNTYKTFAGLTFDATRPGGSHVQVALQSGKTRYWLLPFTVGFRVWDKQTDTLYTGTITDAPGSSYSTITPDAKYVIVFGAGGKKRFLIDHGAQSVETTGTVFYSGGDSAGDHGAFISATNGNNYFVRINSNTSPVRFEAMRIETANTMDYSYNLSVGVVYPYDFHCSAGVRDAAQNWVFFDTEITASTTAENDGLAASDPTSNWSLFRQEVVAWNPVDGTWRRYAHHRSRECVNYYHQPKICADILTRRVAWASSYGAGATGTSYSDMYTMETELTGASTANPPDSVTMFI